MNPTAAVSAVFASAGVLIASWLSRLPAVRDALQITPGRLGLILLALSVGSVLALPSSGPIVHRLRPGPTVLAAATLSTLSMVVVGLAGSGHLGGSPTLAAALFCYGAGVGVWDVAMNVEGAAVEQEVDRAIMPWFHAAFSLGTVAGALIGAAAAALDVPVALHLGLIAVVAWAMVWAGVRGFLPAPEEEPHPDSGARRAWGERRTILIGLGMLGAALAEGSANDWLALGLVDGYGASHAAGAVGLGLFLTAMTALRLAGPVVLDRLGRLVVLRAGALAVLAGVVVFVLAARLAPGPGALALGMAAALLWGAGAALGFPVGISAAADDPVRAPARVSVVSSLGYVAFLAGPPLLGTLGDHVGIVTALLAVAGAVVVSFACAPAARPLLPEPAAD